MSTPTTIVPRTHWLYRYYDASDRLLYVGCTANPSHRDQNHRASSAWKDEIARRTVTEYAQCSEAVAAERQAIAQEQPLHNVQHQIEPSSPIAAAILATGVSVHGLALATGIPAVTLTRRLFGDSSFTIAELAAVAAHLGVPASSLLVDAA